MFLHFLRSVAENVFTIFLNLHDVLSSPDDFDDVEVILEQI